MTKSQHDRVKNNAEAQGHKTVSSYIRSVALEEDLSIHRKIDEIYAKIISEEESKDKDKVAAKLTKALKIEA